MENSSHEKNKSSFSLTDSIIDKFEKERKDFKKTKKIHKKIQRVKKILNIILFIFIIIFILASVYLAIWEINNRRNNKIKDSVSQFITTTEDESSEVPTYTIDFENLKATNESCFGWLKVNGTQINYPIVSSSDNSFYLSHSFDKSYNAAGWPFADYRDLCDGTDRNLIIYAHNRRDGSMFCTLKDILKEEWYTNPENYIIDFYTPDGIINYQVFSVYEIKAESYYASTSFLVDSYFEKFINDLKSRSIYNFDVELTSEDQILTLSTCSNNNAYRTVLHAKKVQVSE